MRDTHTCTTGGGPEVVGRSTSPRCRTPPRARVQAPSNEDLETARSLARWPHARAPARVLCELEDPGPPSAMGKGSGGVEEIGLRADGDVQRRRGEGTGIGLERSRWRKDGGERFAWQSFRLP